MSNSPVTTPKHKKTSSLDIGNSSGRVSRSGGSAHSSGRKSLFNKILRRRSDLIPESIGSSSTKVSQGSIDSPLAQKTNSGDRNGSVSRKSSKNRRSKRFSLGSSSSIIADDNSSVYDYHEGDTREGSIHSDILSSQTSSISDESLDAAIRYSTNFENHDYNEKLTFPTVDAPESELVDDEPIWSGLTFESLVTPKYTKAARKNKHAPRIVNNLFLAQELNTENLSFDHEVQSSDEEADLENNENETGGSDAKASKTHLGYPGIDEEHNEKSDPNKNTQAEIYVMEFSRDGKYLAAAGKDSTIKIWKVILSPLSRLESKNVEQDGGSTAKSSNARDKLFTSAPVFHQEPMCVFEGHTNSILSLDWSKNNFLITGSMDRTAKLWHVDRPNCLQTFQHEDFVTGVKFHPTDDRFFLSGSLDNEFLEDDASAYEYVSNENSSYTTFHAHHSKVNVALFAPESTKRLLEFSDDIIFDLVKRGRKFGLDEPKGTGEGTTTNSTLSLQPFQDNDLGHIIVSADQRGIIRIFRQDAAHEVRKKLIDMQKHNKSYNRSSKV
ncbi:hypothetical protein QCA50_009432 [Cerrena zonata]|uniref:WD40 repeat-like protein n=1 Tax=Cerrena zonata TaxID=2478898 RepID=A0AAW0G5A3_9APHY